MLKISARLGGESIADITELEIDHREISLACKALVRDDGGGNDESGF